MIYSWQKAQWQKFSQLKLQGRLPHAMILTGSEGVGKLSLAKQFVASVMCTDAQHSEPCGHCHSCQLFTAENHPDHTTIMPEEVGKQIKIEQIRQLQAKQELTATVSSWKTVIISPADSMNTSSNNSLLKLLEEPQKNTLLLLLSSKPEKLPITILSRCQKIAFNLPSESDAYEFIKQASNDIDEHTLKRVLSLAKGAPLRALELLDSDIIKQIQDIEDDFELVVNGRANPVQLAKKWQEYDIALTFNHLQALIQQRLGLALDKLSTVEAKRYWYIYDCIVAAIKLISSSNNINKILLIEQFIVSVMDENWNNKSAIN